MPVQCSWVRLFWTRIKYAQKLPSSCAISRNSLHLHCLKKSYIKLELCKINLDSSYFKIAKQCSVVKGFNAMGFERGVLKLTTASPLDLVSPLYQLFLFLPFLAFGLSTWRITFSFMKLPMARPTKKNTIFGSIGTPVGFWDDVMYREVVACSTTLAYNVPSMNNPLVIARHFTPNLPLSWTQAFPSHRIHRSKKNKEHHSVQTQSWPTWNHNPYKSLHTSSLNSWVLKERGYKALLFVKNALNRQYSNPFIPA